MVVALVVRQGVWNHKQYIREKIYMPRTKQRLARERWARMGVDERTGDTRDDLSDEGHVHNLQHKPQANRVPALVDFRDKYKRSEKCQRNQRDA